MASEALVAKCPASAVGHEEWRTGTVAGDHVTAITTRSYRSVLQRCISSAFMNCLHSPASCDAR